jgi:hypothetical protein
MDTVRAISGILVNNFNQTEAVTIMINGHTPSVKELRIALSDLIERLKRAPISRPEISTKASTKAANTSIASASAAKAAVPAKKTTPNHRKHHH